jgi:rod shape-determining protein MreC
VLEKVMSDETVQPGDTVLTSGGDQIFPKGLPVGTVTKVSPGLELFLNIRVKPTVDLSRLEEVLVITQQEEKEPALADGAQPMRAADILAQRLPSVPDRPPDDPNKPPPPTSGLKIFSAPTTQAAPGAAGISKASGAGAASQGQSSQGQASTTAATAAKPHTDAAATAVRPGNGSSQAQTAENPPVVKPAPTKPAPSAVKAPDNVTNAASDSLSQPVSPKPQAQPKQPTTEPAPSQEQPQ